MKKFKNYLYRCSKCGNEEIKLYEEHIKKEFKFCKRILSRDEFFSRDNPSFVTSFFLAEPARAYRSIFCGAEMIIVEKRNVNTK